MPETVPFLGLDEMIARIMPIPTRPKSTHIALTLVGMLVLCVASWALRPESRKLAPGDT